jgi:hypothetical protein
MDKEDVMETVTTAGAGAAVVSPWWLSALTHGSEAATWALPILGCSWLVMQMYFKIKKERKAAPDD